MIAHDGPGSADGFIPPAPVDVAAPESWPARIVWVVTRPLVWLMLGAIKMYQMFLSPVFGARCRYYPSCSQYGFHAIRVHGPFKGLVLAVARIGRCHPWNDGGIDPVPEAGQWRPRVNRDGSPRRANEFSSEEGGHQADIPSGWDVRTANLTTME